MKQMVIVVGSPGAGKTSVVSPLQKSRKYKVVNLGDIMGEIGIKSHLVKRVDEIRYLDNDKNTDLRTKAVERVSKLEGNVILSTHAMVEQHGRYLPGLSYYMFKHFRHVKGFFYIDADTETLLRRRRKDKSRTREIEDKKVLDTQRDLNLAILSYYSTHLNIPLYIINNTDGKLGETRKTFVKDLKDAFGEE
jgi:adenylate kinase